MENGSRRYREIYYNTKLGRVLAIVNKSSAVAEMGDRGNNRHGSKSGGCCAPFAERWEPV